MKITTIRHRAGRVSALLIVITFGYLLHSTTVLADDRELAPDYGIETRFVEAPDAGKSLPVEPPGEYQSPELLGPEDTADVEPPLKVGDEVDEEESPLQMQAGQEASGGDGPKVDLAGSSGNPLLEVDQ
jgi:hypothetical protein